MVKTVKNNDRVREAIRANPGATERELSKIVFGPLGYPQQINGVCRSLLSRKIVRRIGSGGKGYPYRYYVADVEEKPISGRIPKYSEELHQSLLNERKLMLEMKISIIENKLTKARRAVRNRDPDELKEVELPTDTEIGVTLSLLRATNTQLELLKKNEEQRTPE